MTSADLEEKLRKRLRFVPVPGKPNVVMLAAKPNDLPEPEGEPMTEADWDKFEADIEEAFEKVP